MLSLLIVTTLLIRHVNSCIGVQSEGQYYIQKVELLSSTTYPNEVLLTIDRIDKSRTTPSPSGPERRLKFDNNGPWCKRMNVNDGSVSDIVACQAHTTRAWTTADAATTVTCEDNCDGSTATCVVVKNDVTYTIDVAYSNSTGCSSDTTSGSFFVAFTINDTTYISFSSSMVGIKFNNNAAPATTYDIYTVERERRKGDTNAWNALKPTGGWSSHQIGGIYATINAIEIRLNGAVCFGYMFYQYDITSDPGTLTETFALNSVHGPFLGRGYIDDVNLLGFNWGLMYSNQVQIYDFSTGASKTMEPKDDLCDVIRDDCPTVPCDEPGLECPHNGFAKCVNDYCGGCNARWFCGIDDITALCDADWENEEECLTPAPTEIIISSAPTIPTTSIQSTIIPTENPSLLSTNTPAANNLTQKLLIYIIVPLNARNITDIIDSLTEYLVATFDYDYKLEFDVIYKDDHIKIVAVIRYNQEEDIVYLHENELADELGSNIDVIIYQHVDTDTDAEITEYVDDEKYMNVLFIIIGCGLLCCCWLICFLFVIYKKRGKHCHNDKKIAVDVLELSHSNNTIHTMTKGQYAY